MEIGYIRRYVHYVVWIKNEYVDIDVIRECHEELTLRVERVRKIKSYIPDDESLDTTINLSTEHLGIWTEVTSSQNTLFALLPILFGPIFYLLIPL